MFQNCIIVSDIGPELDKPTTEQIHQGVTNHSWKYEQYPLGVLNMHLSPDADRDHWAWCSGRSRVSEGETFTLHSLQYELDEELLQLFIAVVDSKLQHSELQILVMNTIIQTWLKVCACACMCARACAHVCVCVHMCVCVCAHVCVPDNHHCICMNLCHSRSM